MLQKTNRSCGYLARCVLAGKTDIDAAFTIANVVRVANGCATFVAMD
jgi:hypothetical protein